MADWEGKPRKRRRRKLEEEAMYGTLSSSEESEEEDGKFTKPVGFVSAKTTKTGDSSDESDGNRMSNRKDEEMEEADKGRAPAGLGFGGGAGLGFGGGGGGGGGGGLGFGGGGLGFSGKSGQEEDLRGHKPKDDLKFSQRSKDKDGEKTGGGGRRGIGSGPKSKLKNVFEDKDFGAFEKHTKGIGLKLLQKMGFSGGGLGKYEQGLAAPVEVKLREKNAGLGVTREKTQQQIETEKEYKKMLKDRGMLKEDEEASDDESGEDDEPGWKKGAGRNQQGKGKRRKPKIQYKTHEEMMEEKVESQVIVDMRGPQTRVVSDMSKLDSEPGKLPRGKFKELEYNLRLLVDLSEAEISTAERRMRHEDDTLAALKREENDLAHAVAIQEQGVTRMSEVVQIVDKCKERLADRENPLSLKALAGVFDMLQHKYSEEYGAFQLESLAVALAGPSLRDLMTGWDVVEDPDRGLAEFTTWRKLLEAADDRVYDVLVQDTVFPALRAYITNVWKPKDSLHIVDVLEKWAAVLPTRTMTGLVDTLVIPKLRREAEDWNPVRDPIPVHSWIHPWLPLVGDKLAPLYSPLRQKIASALQQWDPSDLSALNIIAPWQAVWPKRDWDMFLLKNIVPKLAEALRGLTINPADQQVDPVKWVIAWEGLVTESVMTRLFEVEFFPKWYHVLALWLNGENSNFDEVTVWYSRWKELFSVQMQEALRVSFNRALEMMNQALSDETVTVPDTRTAARPASAPEPMMTEDAPVRRPVMDANISLKDMVEQYAAENDLLFMPKEGRRHEGKQVYMFGKAAVVVEQNRLVVQQGAQWVSTSLGDLVDLALTKK